MNTETIVILTGWASFAIGYTVHYELLYGQKLRASLERRLDRDRAEIVRVVIARSSLAFFFFVVPAFTLLATRTGISPFDYLAARPSWPRLLVITGISALIVGLLLVNPGRKKLAVAYPQMRVSSWTTPRIALNLGMWAIYLFAYEWMFRGLLLVPLLSLGVVPAFTINTAVYVAVHVPKGRSEAIGAVVFGLVACILAVEWGSVWAPFWLHFVLSASNSFIAIRENRTGRSTG